MREKDLYPDVARWLETEHKCFETGINKGLKYSRVDVVGVRDVGGDLSGEVEIIGVEVKAGRSAFATSCGQAYGYKVYANRVYLADIREEGFSHEETQIASNLGIGLIQIKGTRIREILSSPYYDPYANFRLRMLECLHLGTCRLCGSCFKLGEDRRYGNLAREDVSKAIKQEKGILFWNRETSERKRSMGIRGGREDITYQRRFVCPDCVYSLLSQLGAGE